MRNWNHNCFCSPNEVNFCYVFFKVITMSLCHRNLGLLDVIWYTSKRYLLKFLKLDTLIISFKSYPSYRFLNLNRVRYSHITNPRIDSTRINASRLLWIKK